MKRPLTSLFVFSFIAIIAINSRAQQAASPIQTFEQRRAEMLLRHAIETGRYLKEQQAVATKRGDLATVNTLQSQLDEILRIYKSLQSPGKLKSSLVSENEAFVARLKGRSWRMQSEGEPLNVSFDGGMVLWRTDRGITKHTLQYEVMWPSLLRVKHSDGKIYFYFFDAELANLAALEAAGEFPAKLSQPQK